MKEAVTHQENALAILWHPTEQKVLLGLREELPIWYLPGGKVDAGENFYTAMIRELKEETNLDASIIQQVGTMHYQNSRGIEKNMVFYLCQANDERPCVMDEEIAWEWFSPDALPANLYSPFRQIIFDAWNGKTGQAYERDISSEQFALSVHASQMHGLDEWLTHPRIHATAKDNKLSFPVAEIPGIQQYKQAATLINYQRNHGLMTKPGLQDALAAISTIPFLP